MLTKIYFVICLLLLSTFGLCQKIDIDWKSTAWGNTAMDIYQTNQFMNGPRPREEWNPLVAPFVNSRDHLGFTATALAFSWGIDRLIQMQPAKDRKTYYIIWALAEIAATTYNMNTNHDGFPIVIFKITWK
jgi:hypothetical protein